MERINIIIHKDLRILLFDGKNLKEDELIENIRKHCDSAIINKINLWILDVTNTRSTPKIKEAASDSMKKAISQLGNVYSAVIGLSSVQRLIANAINHDQYFAADMEDAKDWLVTKIKKSV